MKYTLKHASMLALGLILGIGTMAFTDILHPISSFIPSSLVLDTDHELPETMGWVDERFGFYTDNPTGLLEIRWYCVYEGMGKMKFKDVDGDAFGPVYYVDKPEVPDDVDEDEFYYELTRVQTDPCPVFRNNRDYPEE